MEWEFCLGGNIMIKKFFAVMLALLSVVCFAQTRTVSASPSSEWWNQDWHYRIKVDVCSENFERKDEPVELIIDFESLFFLWGIPGSLDTNSVRVIDQSESPTEVLSQFEPSSGEIIWLTGSMEAWSSKTYYVYFDSLENNPKSPPSYYNKMEDVGILVLPTGDHISVICKIGDTEYETAKIDEMEFHRDSTHRNDFSVAWLPPGWDYRKSHTINGSPVGLLTNYPIRIVVNYGSGIDSGEDVYVDNNSRSDFGDVRFTSSNGSTQLDYWIEEKIDGNYAVFWVEVDSIPSSPGSTTVYIYYGNVVGTTTSNGRNTFDWLDDFFLDSSASYDIGRHTTTWHGGGVYNPYYDAVNRRVAFDTGNNFTGGWMVRSFNLSIQNFAAKVTFGVSASSNTTNGILGRWTGNSAYYGFYVAGGSYTSPALVRDARTTIIASPPSNTYHPFGGTPHTAELRIYGNSLTGIYNEGEVDEVVLTATDSTHAGAGQVEVIVSQGTGWFDVLFVRKYVEPEPNHGSWGDEEGSPVYFMVTGSSSMTAGTSNELTITAYDANGNVATGYTGSQNLTFSGPSSTPDGTMPTVEGIDVGTTTTVNFTDGVSDAGAATLIAYMAETTEVDVTDGTIDSFGDPSYDLDLTVNPGVSALSNEVNVFKQFRDKYLLTNELGQAFVSAYYKYSLPLADWIAKHPLMRKMVRIGLYPVLGLSKCFMGEIPSNER
jgi:hypothetical protein